MYTIRYVLRALQIRKTLENLGPSINYVKPHFNILIPVQSYKNAHFEQCEPERRSQNSNCPHPQF